MYRAMSSADVGRMEEGQMVLESFDLASLAGVLKYVHTEVVAEHIIGAPERRARKNDIDVISRFPTKIRNPDTVLDPSSYLTNQVDFGPFVTFDYGVATNPDTQVWMKKHGGFVGVQQQYDPRWPFLDPYFWFSVTGFCPNLAYDKIPMTREQYEHLIAQRDGKCSKQSGRMACRLLNDECEFRDDACRGRDPVPQCLRQADKADRAMLGGLCPGGAGVLVDPTGQRGCTYSYGKAQLIWIDKLAGIQQEDCGGRLCKNWLDFRQHCSNKAYRFMFDANGKKVPFKYCVEYDIVPACQSDCHNAACQAVPEDQLELGLPFWRGRCNSFSNKGRFMDAVDADNGNYQGATLYALSSKEAPCVRENPGTCAPAQGQGGNYCTRHWSGVCTNCFVPGTLIPFPAADYMPYCPYDVLQSPDYKDFPLPQCKSTVPSDLCCLYAGTCSTRAPSENEAPISEDGFALVASWVNTSATAQFLARAARVRGSHVEAASLRTLVREHWNASPARGWGLKEALEMMKARHLD